MSKPRPCPMLDQASQARLGEKLRRMYDGLPEAPLPQRLESLIGALEQAGAPESVEAGRPSAWPRSEGVNRSSAPGWRKPRIPVLDPRGWAAATRA